MLYEYQIQLLYNQCSSLSSHVVSLFLSQEVCIDFARVNNYIKAEKNLLSLM